MPSPDLRFEDQVAVVTGAGNGLGRTYAVELARRGASVVVNDLGGAPDGTGGAGSVAAAVVDEITAAGGMAVADTHSVADPAGAAALIDSTVASFGRVDIVINNAGILRDRSFARMSIDEFDAVTAVHQRGSFLVAQQAFVRMKEQNYGRLLFTTSVSGLFGNFGQANYAAAKMGLVGLSAVAAIEGARYGITSNVIAPTARTRLTEDLMGDIASRFDPEWVTPLAVYLVSRECRLTHEILLAGAGWYSRAFVGVGPGWFSDTALPPPAEAIVDHLDELSSETGYLVPDSTDPLMQLMQPRAVAP